MDQQGARFRGPVVPIRADKNIQTCWSSRGFDDEVLRTTVKNMDLRTAISTVRPRDPWSTGVASRHWDVRRYPGVGRYGTMC